MTFCLSLLDTDTSQFCVVSRDDETLELYCRAFDSYFCDVVHTGGRQRGQDDEGKGV